MQPKHFAIKALIAALIVIAFAACKNAAEIPFPDEPEFPQPITKPVQFSAEEKIVWSDSTTGVRPTVKKFDIDKLPSAFFDSSRFIPFKARFRVGVAA